MKLPVIGTSYAHGRTAVTARVAENIWFERRGEGEKAPVIATHLPGTAQTIALPGILGAWRNPAVNYEYVHTASTLYRVNTATGTIDATMALPWTAIVPMEMCGTATRIVFLMGALPYYVAPTLIGAPTLITLPDGQQAVSCAWLGGYFWIYCASGRVYWSVDGATWDALDFANSETLSDSGFRVRTIGDKLVLIGERTIEFWGSTGVSAIPYRLIPGSTIQFDAYRNGLRQVANVGDRLFIWGSANGGRNGLYELRGNAMQHITTSDLEFATADTFLSISAFEWFGRPFVSLYRQGGVSWLIDVDMGVASRIVGTTAYAGHVTFLASQSQVNVANSAGVRRMDPTLVDADIRRITTDNLVSPDLDRITVDKVRLDVQAETVTVTASRDGGATWGTARSKAASAARGVRAAVQFDRFGTAAQFTFSVAATGPFILSNIIVNPKN